MKPNTRNRSDSNTAQVHERQTKIMGRFVQVDATGNYALFFKDGGIADEFPIADLVLLNLKSDELVLLADSLLADRSTAKFVGMNRIAFINNGILIYSIDKRKYDTLISQTSPSQSIIGCASGSDGSKIVLVIKDYASHKFLIRFIESGVQVKLDGQLLAFEDSEMDEKLVVPTFWVNNTIAVSIGGKLLLYDVNVSKTEIVTENLAYFNDDDLVAADTDFIVFYTFGENHKLILNEYNLRNNKLKVVEDSKVPLDYDRASLLSLTEGIIDENASILLCVNSETYIYASSSWVRLDNNYLFRGSGIYLMRGDNAQEFYLSSR